MTWQSLFWFAFIALQSAVALLLLAVVARVLWQLAIRVRVRMARRGRRSRRSG